MKQEDKGNAVSIAIKNIKELDFVFNSDYDYSQVKIDNLKLELTRKFGIDFKEKNFAVSVILMYRHKDTVLVKLGVLVNFEIVGLENVAELLEDGFKVKDDRFIINLLSIVLGTLRGILYTKLVNTPLEGYPLPLFSPDHIKRIANKRNV